MNRRLRSRVKAVVIPDDKDDDSQDKSTFFSLPEEVRDLIFVYVTITELVVVERVSKKWQLEIGRALAAKRAIAILPSLDFVHTLNVPEIAEYNALCNIKGHQFEPGSIVHINRRTIVQIDKFVLRFPNLFAIYFAVRDKKAFKLAMKTLFDRKDSQLEHVCVIPLLWRDAEALIGGQVTCAENCGYSSKLSNLKYFKGSMPDKESLIRLMKNGLRGLAIELPRDRVEVLRCLEEKSNLEHLRVSSIDPRQGSVLSGYWLGLSKYIKNLGPQLKSLDFVVESARDFIDVMKFCPNLEELRLRNFNLQYVLDDPLLNKVTASKVTFLHIDMTSNDIRKLIRRFPILKEIVGVTDWQLENYDMVDADWKVVEEFKAINIPEKREMRRNLVERFVDC